MFAIGIAKPINNDLIAKFVGESNTKGKKVQ